MENEAVYGGRLLGSLLSHSPATSFLKMSHLSGERDLKPSFLTFPESGMMRNGIVFEARTLATPSDADESLLLPTPVATDHRVSYCDHPALLRYIAAGRQQRLIYVAQLAGLTDTEILELYREVMSFTISDAKYTPSATQSCLF